MAASVAWVALEVSGSVDGLPRAPETVVITVLSGDSTAEIGTRAQRDLPLMGSPLYCLVQEWSPIRRLERLLESAVQGLASPFSSH